MVKGSCCPSEIAKELIGVGVQEIEYLADVGNAGVITSAATNFGKEGLSLAIFQPFQNLGEHIGGLDARGGGARAVGVEILMDVEDEAGGAAVGVGDASKGGC